MIWDSVPWKEQLYKDAIFLEKAMLYTFSDAHPKREEAKLVRIERTLFVACFSIRKLMDSKKLSMDALNYSIPAIKYAATYKKMPDLMNWDHFDEHFNLDNSIQCNFSSRDLCNLHIHSFQFVLLFKEDGRLEGIMLSSDREKKKWLYMVKLTDIIKWIHYIAEDDIVSLEMFRNKEGDWQIAEAKREI